MRFVVSVSKDSGLELFEDLSSINSKERSKRIKVLASIGLALLKSGINVQGNTSSNFKKTEPEGEAVSNLSKTNSAEFDEKTSKLNKIKSDWNGVF